MKLLISLSLFIGLFQISSLANLPPQGVDARSIWQGVTILPNDTLFKYILNDLPGTICVLVPGANGTLTPYLVGEKVLKESTNLPALNATPTTLISTEISGDEAADISYIAIATASAGKTNDIRFTATETAHTEILDNEIDWATFNSTIATIKQQNPNLPAGTQFAVVQVASVLTVTYQSFTQVNSAAKISGWGFSGNGNYQTQSSDLQNAFIVGVNLAYSPAYLGELFPRVPLAIISGTNNTTGAIMGGGLGNVNVDSSANDAVKGALDKVVNLDVSKRAIVTDDTLKPFIKSDFR